MKLNFDALESANPFQGEFVPFKAWAILDQDGRIATADGQYIIHKNRQKLEEAIRDARGERLVRVMVISCRTPTIEE